MGAQKHRGCVHRRNLQVGRCPTAMRPRTWAAGIRPPRCHVSRPGGSSSSSSSSSGGSSCNMHGRQGSSWQPCDKGWHAPLGGSERGPRSTAPGWSQPCRHHRMQQGCWSHSCYCGPPSCPSLSPAQHATCRAQALLHLQQHEGGGGAASRTKWLLLAMLNSGTQTCVPAWRLQQQQLLVFTASCPRRHAASPPRAACTACRTPTSASHLLGAAGRPVARQQHHALARSAAAAPQTHLPGPAQLQPQCRIRAVRPPAPGAAAPTAAAAAAASHAAAAAAAVGRGVEQAAHGLPRCSPSADTRAARQARQSGRGFAAAGSLPGWLPGHQPVGTARSARGLAAAARAQS